MPSCRWSDVRCCVLQLLPPHYVSGRRAGHAPLRSVACSGLVDWSSAGGWLSPFVGKQMGGGICGALCWSNPRRCPPPPPPCQRDIHPHRQSFHRAVGFFLPCSLQQLSDCDRYSSFYSSSSSSTCSSGLRLFSNLLQPRAARVSLLFAPKLHAIFMTVLSGAEASRSV